MYTVFDVNDIASLRVDEETGTITIRQKSQAGPLYINKDDELYKYHLKSADSLKQQCINSWTPKEDDTE